VSKVAVVKTRKQHARVGVTQSFDVGITTTRVETVVMPNIDVVRKGVLIVSIAKLGSGLSEVLVGRNLSQSLRLLTATTRVVGIPQMVFTYPIMTTHGNKTADQPLMSSMVIGRYISVDVMHPKRGYQKPFAITTPTLDHRDGHYVKPNRVAVNYPNYKKHADPNGHVRMFNFVVKVNVETFEKFIINAFNYTLKDMISDWCHNYMLKFPDYCFLELHMQFANVIKKFRMLNKYTWS
jgi:hypothetical protein